jgi:hypothetical protein
MGGGYWSSMTEMEPSETDAGIQFSSIVNFIFGIFQARSII